MSILCLICKDKLLGYSHGGALGSLNNLVENSIIATACGHLYHIECLQSWFRTQQRKLQIQGLTAFVENGSNICPSCQTEVREIDHRRIYPLEDHREALDKARILERQENLEIYCHQLEIQIQQLQRENDFLVNKILTPPATPTDDYDTIVKNDRVVWMRKGDSSLNGIVLSIFKKEDKLCAKIKLDKKIRTNQRTSRILSSFRLDRKQELTVPFDEIVLEKDYINITNNNTSLANRNINGSVGLGGGGMIGNRSVSSASIYQSYHGGNSSSCGNLHHTNSTLSLPGDPRRLFGIQESISEVETTTTVPSIETSNALAPPRFNRSISLSPDFQPGGVSASTSSSNSKSSSPLTLPRDVSSPQSIQFQTPSITGSDVSLDEQRDYVYITPSWIKNQAPSKPKLLEGRSSPPDGKNKHVTFADDPAASKGGLEDVPDQVLLKAESNKIKTDQMPLQRNSLNIDDNEDGTLPPLVSDRPIQPKPRKKAPSVPQPPTAKPRNGMSIDLSDNSASNKPSPMQPNDKLSIFNDNVDGSELVEQVPIFELSLYETMTRTNVPIPIQEPRNSVDSSDILGMLQDFSDEDEGSPENDKNSCIDVTLLSLLYNSNSFDEVMLSDNSKDSEFCRSVKWIIRERFIHPLRKRGRVESEYSKSLKQTITHLCSESLDVEELLTILFEFTYKLRPFINYSLEMCDYLHQFFIDFTDKSKVQTVKGLLEKSLLLQDNLKLEGGPSPALILQMPHSDDGVIHYDGVIPNLTMRIDHIIDEAPTGNKKKCYCDNEATLECKVCTENHGDSAILFCQNCQELLQGIHKGHDHDLQISNIEYPDSKPKTAIIFVLSSIICLKDGKYQVFLKQGQDVFSPWVYVHAISDGQLQIKELPGFGYWLESILENNRNGKSTNIDNVPSLLKKVLKYCRVFVYSPLIDSESEA